MFGRLPWLALERRMRALRFLVFFDIGVKAIGQQPKRHKAFIPVATWLCRWNTELRPHLLWNRHRCARLKYLERPSASNMRLATQIAMFHPVGWLAPLSRQERELLPMRPRDWW